VRVEVSGSPALATQLYLADEPGNARDFLFRQMSTEERAQLTLRPRRTESSHPLAQSTQLSAAVDLVIG
jgi:protocatechuate 3,4-dioxygenase beta subunit